MELDRRIDDWIVAWCSLTQRARLWQAQLEAALEPHQLPPTDLLVLWRTAHSLPPGISQVELARELRISAGQVCGIVESLQSRGWLRLQRSREDRRRSFCTLTPHGETALAEIVAEILPRIESCRRDDSPTGSPAARRRGTQEDAA